jgi:predicted protein tyrosine phosphatase
MNMENKKILFVCSLNWHRSKTAETYFSNLEKFDVKSAGIKNYAEKPITKELLDWADLIFVMEEKHKKNIEEKFANSKEKYNIICLNIEDIYRYMDHELISILRDKMEPYL